MDGDMLSIAHTHTNTPKWNKVNWQRKKCNDHGLYVHTKCVQFNLFIAWPTHLIRDVFLERRCGAQWMDGRTGTHAHILYRIILQSDKIINSFCVCRKKSDLANVLMFNQHELYIDAMLTEIKAPRIKISNRFYCWCSVLLSLLLSPLS